MGEEENRILIENEVFLSAKSSLPLAAGAQLLKNRIENVPFNKFDDLK